MNGIIRRCAVAVLAFLLLAAVAVPDIRPGVPGGDCCPRGEDVGGETHRVCEGFWFWQSDGCIHSQDHTYATAGAPCDEKYGVHTIVMPRERTLYDVAYGEIREAGWYVFAATETGWELTTSREGVEGAFYSSSGCVCRTMSNSFRTVTIGTVATAVTCTPAAPPDGEGNPVEGPGRGEP